jgi:hypothetical protein
VERERAPAERAPDATMFRLIAILVLLAVQALPSDAYAERLIRAQGPRLRQACAGDYLRLCRGVPLGRGRALNCLNAQADQLSQACFQALAVRGLAYAGALKICRPDYERLCAGVAPGWDSGLQCMLENAPSLSPTCRDALSRQGVLDGDPNAMP